MLNEKWKKSLHDCFEKETEAEMGLLFNFFHSFYYGFIILKHYKERSENPKKICTQIFEHLKLKKCLLERF